VIAISCRPVFAQWIQGLHAPCRHTGANALSGVSEVLTEPLLMGWQGGAGPIPDGDFMSPPNPAFHDPLHLC